ncbi:MAG: TIGR03984 family CRISPR-associated protein [Anaerolineae bacterium]|nr:TIGR03984 family CRISPR-associated protein [Anaerolineae bacterium]
MNREIVSAFAELHLLDIEEIQDIGAWFTEHAQAHHLRWLLVHADDAVLWGMFEASVLVLDDSARGLLRLETLQVARAFGEEAEVMLWRDGDGALRARFIRDSAGEKVWTMDEDHVLWGNRTEKLSSGFTRMSEGSQGLCHVVPLSVEVRRDRKRPLRLRVRHYLTEDETGFVRIACSRLLDLVDVGGSER